MAHTKNVARAYRLVESPGKCLVAQKFFPGVPRSKPIVLVGSPTQRSNSFSTPDLIGTGFHHHFIKSTSKRRAGALVLHFGCGVADWFTTGDLGLDFTFNRDVLADLDWTFVIITGCGCCPSCDKIVEEEAPEYARFISNSLAEVFPVGTKKPNVYGLYDMGGNVAEWIGEFYEYYPDPGVAPSWFDLPNRELRIVRGGGFSADLSITRTYWRSGTLGRVATAGIGVRCAKNRD